ncbi:hypothetical protein HDG69_002845 [Isoptericola halotolerans]|uniref:Uncharacterized protein n=1 Tax=Isoptericola halotolerans TaxID=300560 RepID=A0ABX2A5X5_9MICO|nr:hypothetical protein [Isoptericola halotolerans]
MGEGQLDGVADLLDLRPQPADVLVGDVRDLLEDELLHLGLGHHLEHEPAAHVDGQRVAHPQRRAQYRTRQADDPLLVRATDDQDTLGVEHLLDGHQLTDALVATRGDDGHRLVQLDLLTRRQRVEVQPGAGLHVHLATGRDHVDGAVVVRRQERGVRPGRLRQVVDLLLELDDLVPRGAQRLGEPLVLRREQRQLRLAARRRGLDRLRADRVVGHRVPSRAARAASSTGEEEPPRHSTLRVNTPIASVISRFGRGVHMIQTSP